MNHHDYAYGAWGLVITLVLVSLFFIVKFLPTRTKFEKRSGGALFAFLLALFTEMYGFPLTIYLLSHFVGIPIPLDHISGHLLGDLITWLGLGNGWFMVMLVSNVLIILGIWIITAGWERTPMFFPHLFSRRAGKSTHSGNSKIRHPAGKGGE